MIKCVIFDMAGTTVKDNDTVAYSLRYAFNTQFVPTIQQIKSLMGTDKRETISKLLESNVEIIHRDFVRRMNIYYKTHGEEVDGASCVFNRLRARGIKVALNTGFPRIIADTIIEKLKWTDKIDISVCSDEVEFGRPAPDMIWEISNILCMPTVNIAKVGDTRSDIEEGKNAECGLVVGVSYGSDGREKLINTGAMSVIDSLEEILKLI